MENLVCKECGNGEFTGRHSAVIEKTVSFSESGYEIDIDETVLDLDRDCDEFTCTDCFENYTDSDELITEEAYNDAD